MCSRVPSLRATHPRAPRHRHLTQPLAQAGPLHSPPYPHLFSSTRCAIASYLPSVSPPSPIFSHHLPPPPTASHRLPPSLTTSHLLPPPHLLAQLTIVACRILDLSSDHASPPKPLHAMPRARLRAAVLRYASALLGAYPAVIPQILGSGRLLAILVDDYAASGGGSSGPSSLAALAGGHGGAGGGGGTGGGGRAVPQPIRRAALDVIHETVTRGAQVRHLPTSPHPPMTFSSLLSRAPPCHLSAISDRSLRAACRLQRPSESPPSSLPSSPRLRQSASHRRSRMQAPHASPRAPSPPPSQSSWPRATRASGGCGRMGFVGYIA